MPFVCQVRAEALASLGHEVHVVTSYDSRTAGTTGGDSVLGYTNYPYREPAIHHRNLTIHYVGEAPAHQWSAELGLAARQLAFDLKPDIVHCDSFDRRRPFWLGVPFRTAITCHGFGQGSWLTKCNLARAKGLPLPPRPDEELNAEAGVLGTADVVIGVSRHECNMLRGDYGLANVKLVPNPIPDYFFTPLSAAPQTYFLSAAISGQDIRGFAQAKEACRLAGVPFREARGIRREDMPAVYDGAKALLLPTAYSQGHDLSVAESRARGVPAIVSNVGSYLTEAEPFDCLVRPLNVEDMVIAIRSWREPDRETIRAAADAHRPAYHAVAWLDAVQ